LFKAIPVIVKTVFKKLVDILPKILLSRQVSGPYRISGFCMISGASLVFLDIIFLICTGTGGRECLSVPIFSFELLFQAKRPGSESVQKMYGSERPKTLQIRYTATGGLILII
jgi:hypothetical protein